MTTADGTVSYIYDARDNQITATDANGNTTYLYYNGNNQVVKSIDANDETYYSLMMRDRIRDEDGNLLRGLSRNQICIGVATDKKHTIYSS